MSQANKPVVTVKTELRLKREAQDKAVSELYTQLMSQPDAMPTAVAKAVMIRFGFNARSTVWNCLNRHRRVVEAASNGGQTLPETTARRTSNGVKLRHP